MRSRTEAKWAAVFDAKGLLWEYEPRCFADGYVQYLPDFYLLDPSGEDIYAEIKGYPVDDIAAVQRRMEVVWASEPSAVLALFTLEGPWVAYNDGEGWERV